MTLLSQILQYAVSGVTGGSIYAIIGICWSLVYLVTTVLNFATGEFVMLGGMLTWALHKAGLGLLAAGAAATLFTTLLAVFLERVVIRPVRYPTELTYMMLTIAAGAVIKGLVLLKWGSDTRNFEPFFGSGVLHFGGATLTPQVLAVLGLLVVVTASLSLFLNRTLFGKALRASAINNTGARLMGINIGNVRLFCFGLAGALGALTGVFIAPITFTGYEIGMLTGLKGLVAAIVGGWTMTGTVAAGLALGLLEGFFAGFFEAGLKDVFALSAMVVFLILETTPVFLRWRRS
ncbi:MAG: branched-chain amino acid ABC transporter permease [Deltaproteobacteria bacterium]|nr:branched-chain amino acid ABC transporter permease [Deltaproteobacteria bacterium]